MIYIKVAVDNEKYNERFKKCNGEMGEGNINFI